MRRGDLYLWVTIKRFTDARGLYEKVKGYGMNLTEAIDTTYVYGNTDMETATKVIALCEQHGTTEVSLSHVGK